MLQQAHDLQEFGAAEEQNGITGGYYGQKSEIKEQRDGASRHKVVFFVFFFN